jgi:hypothetical protein
MREYQSFQKNKRIDDEAEEDEDGAKKEVLYVK